MFIRMSSRVQHIVGQAALDSTLAKAGSQLVIVDCGATWCGPCKQIAPFFDKLSVDHPDVIFCKVLESESSDIIASQNVSAFPTFLFFIKKQKIHELKGSNPKALTDAVEEYKAKAGPSSFGGTGNALGSSSGTSLDPRAARLAFLERAGAGGSSKHGPAVAAAAPAPAPAPATHAATHVATSAAASAPAPAVHVAAPAPSQVATSAAPAVATAHVATPAPPAAAARSFFKPSPALQAQMLELDIPAPRVWRALQATSNASVEAAFEWLELHQDDPGLDDPVPEPLEPAAAAAGGQGGTGEGGAMTAEDDAAVASAQSDLSATGETRKLSAEEVTALLVKRRAEKAELAKVEARKREIQRREDGRKGLDMSEQLLEMQRKNDAAKIKADKLASQVERDRLKLELLRDKAERHSARGEPVPPELMAQIAACISGGKHVAAAAEGPPLSRTEALTAATKQLAAYRSPGTSRTAANTLRTLCNNALTKPGEAKFQSINLSNTAIKEKLTSLVGGIAFLKAAGWTKNEAAGTMEFTAAAADGSRDDSGLIEAVAMLDQCIAAGLFP